MVLGIIIAILFILLLVGMVVFALSKIKQTDPKKIDSSAKEDIKTAQEFLIFDDIADSVIDLGGFQYRAIIEVSSVNYNLRTEREQEVIELSFQRFLNSLTYPITLFVQTRTIDSERILSVLRKDMGVVLNEYPELEEYANVYYENIADLNNQIGNNKEKKKYIIVHYDEAIKLTNYSDEEKYNESVKEIMNRCQLIKDSLYSMGLKPRILNTREIVKFIGSVYYKDNYAQFDEVVNGNFLSLKVDGENRLENLSPDGRLDWILYEAEMRLKEELADNKAIPDDVKYNATKSIKELEKIRDSLAGYFKTNVL